MAGEKTQAELKAQIDAGIRVNGNREITPPIHNAIETAIINSNLNKKDGGILEAISFYSSLFTLTDPKSLVYKQWVEDLITSNPDGFLTQGTNTLTEPLIFTDDKVGFGGTPSGAVHFVLPDDPSPLSKTAWSDKDAVFGEVGSTGKALGVSYTDSTSTINLNFLEPTVQWLKAQINAATFAIYSSGSVLGLFQSASGKLGVGTATPIADAQLTIKGIDDSDDDFQLKTTNGSDDVIFSIRNDGLVNVNGDLAIPDGNFQYFKGNESTNGSIRVGMVGVELVAQRRESGSWVTQTVIIS